MFHATRRLSAALPFLFLGIGLLRQPALVPLPAALMLGFLFWRHRRILALTGTAPLASDGFARHVMVDDLLRLAGQVLASPLLYLLGAGLAGLIVAS